MRAGAKADVPFQISGIFPEGRPARPLHLFPAVGNAEPGSLLDPNGISGPGETGGAERILKPEMGGRDFGNTKLLTTSIYENERERRREIISVEGAGSVIR